MANIAINNYCNLRCRYCFADEMMKQKNKNISIEDLRTILGFLSKTPRGDQVGIIGGEPTLHPNFSEVLKEINRYCVETVSTAMLFTNGTNLEKYIPDLREWTGILINVNSPKYVQEKEYQNTIRAIECLDASWFAVKRANIGCNIYPGLNDYDYIWDIVKRYHINHIRTSVVSPGGCFIDMRNDKEKYYNILKPVFLEYCKNAIKHDCVITLDCGHIPECFFTEDELEIVHRICERPRNNFCEPVIDITQDFLATSCFGIYDPVDIRNFENIFELERYLLVKKIMPRVENNASERCKTCNKYELLQCNGGCLGFANMH